MTKRWKPGFGDVYYFIDSAFDVDIESYEGHSWDDERFAVGNCFNTKDDAHAAAEKVKALLLSLHNITHYEELPSEAVAVFDTPEINPPEWCQIGNWASVYDRYKNNWEYFVINKVKRNYVTSDNGLEFYYYDLKPARIHPWTFSEAPEIIKIKTDTNCTLIATIVSNGGEWGYRLAHPGGMGDIVSFDYIAKNYIQLDGKPCGVPEHLNENGEWVK